MKHIATPSNYEKVIDGRGKPVDGLWIRNGVYYAQFRVFNVATGKRSPIRKRLNATNTPGAVKEMRKVLAARDQGDEPTTGRMPTVAGWLKDWLEHYSATHAPGSVMVRRKAVGFWTEKLGSLKLDKVRPQMIRKACDGLLADGYNPHTVNSNLDALSMALKQAVVDGVITANPMLKVSKYRTTANKKKLFTIEEIEKFETALRSKKQYGSNAADLLLVLAFSGMRIQEALQTKWAHVDFERQALAIGIDYRTKSGKVRSVDFNGRLEAILKDMRERRLPDSEWLFPSSIKVENRLAQTPKTWATVQAETGIHITPHSLRHFFTSFAVMSGIDWLTIAAWLGHSDASLIAKTYGHLRKEHRQQQARRMQFQPVVIAKEAA